MTWKPACDNIKRGIRYDLVTLRKGLVFRAWIKAVKTGEIAGVGELSGFTGSVKRRPTSARMLPSGIRLLC